MIVLDKYVIINLSFVIQGGYMLYIAICDDEAEFRLLIKEIIEEYLYEKGIDYQIDLYSDGKDIIELGADIIKYKIFFLDVNMDKLNGIDTARNIRGLNQDAFIVFTTAYIEYALDGYGVEAIRYILKNRSNFKHDLYECMDTIVSKMKYTIIKKKFDFNEGVKILNLGHLVYVESKLHKLIFHVAEDRECIYTMYGTLNNLENDLTEVEDLLRVHQSFLVNMKYIDRIKRYSIYLLNGKEIDIPKARYKDVEKALVKYKGEI